MALTPEDVVNKRFNPTKFREGYDQDEVDDFLDEVVVELRRLNQENEELRQRLVAGEATHQRAAAQCRGRAGCRALRQPSSPAAPVAAPEPGRAAAARRCGHDGPEQHQQPAPARAPPARGARARGHGEARRPHRRGPRHGRPRRLRGPASPAGAAGRTRAAEGSLEQQKQSLEQEKQSLERQVDELRTFEQRVPREAEGYIEGQLRELESLERADRPAPRRRRRTGAHREQPSRQPAVRRRLLRLQRPAVARLQRVPAAHRLPGLCRRQLSRQRRPASRAAGASASALLLLLGAVALARLRTRPVRQVPGRQNLDARGRTRPGARARCCSCTT